MPNLYSSGVSRLLSNSGCAAAVATSATLRVAQIGQRYVIAIPVAAGSIEGVIRWTINAAEAGLFLRLRVCNGHSGLIRQGTATPAGPVGDRHWPGDALARARHHLGNELIELGQCPAPGFVRQQPRAVRRHDFPRALAPHALMHPSGFARTGIDPRIVREHEAQRGFVLLCCGHTGLDVETGMTTRAVTLDQVGAYPGEAFAALGVPRPHVNQVVDLSGRAQAARQRARGALDRFGTDADDGLVLVLGEPDCVRSEEHTSGLQS